MKDNSGIKQPVGFAAMRMAAVILIVALVIIAQTGCSGKEQSSEPVSKSEFCLNTTCEISIYGMGESEADDILDGAFDKIKKYENMFSKTVSGSDVDKINRAGGKTVKVSEDTYNVISLGIEIGRLSGGRFDISVGRITELWDFQSDEPKLPAQGDIDEALKTIGYEKITLGDDNSVTLEDSGTALDLGGIAKGYIADRVTEYLEEKGVGSAIVNLGGNIVAVGEKPDGETWNIGVERPYSDRTELIGSVRASDATVVTSGIYERMFRKGGKLYHHVLDPRTGYPAETELEAVTVTASKGYSAYCDGLSTTCLMLGREKSEKLIEQLRKKMPEAKFEASFTDKDDKVTQTDGMNLELSENE